LLNAVSQTELQYALALARAYGFTDGPVHAVAAERPLRLTPDGQEGPGGRQALRSLAERLQGCTRCSLAESRRNVVIGEGDPEAELMFIEMVPGADEDRAGKPCQGEAGELLTRIVEAGLQRSRHEVYIASAVKCRPAQDRPPDDLERATCRPFLEGQIAAVRPRVLVLLGDSAVRAFDPGAGPVAEIRGQFIEVCGLPAMPTHHPRELLADPTLKRAVWQDIKTVIARLGWSRS
jgi:uracil-DNA glycosylase family 4